MSAVLTYAPVALARDERRWWITLQASVARRCRTHVGVGVALGAILMLQAGASLLLRNTAFQDEALYLYAGRQIVDNLQGGPSPSDAYAAFFSGLPYLYPVIAGLISSSWGLEGARLLSLACMLGATTAVYVLGRRLFDANTGLLGAALFAVQAPVLFVSRVWFVPSAFMT